MNLLAHAVLAATGLPRTAGQELTGALMADYLGGTPTTHLPPGLRLGIAQHRAIDDFTDHHPAFIRACAHLDRAGAPRHSAGILLDIYWDHILAADWAIHGAALTGTSLADFAQYVYRALEANYLHHNPTFTRLLPWLVNQDWLSAYGNLDGIQRSINGLAARLPHGAPLRDSHRLLAAHHTVLQDAFTAFWPAALATFGPGGTWQAPT